MLNIKNIFTKIKPKKFITKISTTYSFEINPKEIMPFSKITSNFLLVNIPLPIITLKRIKIILLNYFSFSL
ncbi:Hypothetical protein BHW_0015300 (plasmid) [Borrelia hermsii MTW]|uniref:Uncharacterized protein n=1 Tax=Borrelia hermsii MTW TaxID=1313291 RepID=W5T6E3_BORHE|nr:Hypothetical protein BHW_0015300 [Borrelia hermsii MTW]